MAKYRTRKDWRVIGNFPYELWEIKKHVCAQGRKKELKFNTARKSRRRPITDETPYKRLDDKYHYC